MNVKDHSLNARTTINPAFNAIARDEFSAMIDAQRYLSRSSEFDTLIARTNEHFWDPQDGDYIDYQAQAPRDEPLIPFEQIPERHSAIWDTLDEAGKLRFTNESLRMRISGVLHGEQGALSLSTGPGRHVRGSRSAGVCLQSSSRRSPSCSRLCALCECSIRGQGDETITHARSSAPGAGR